MVHILIMEVMHLAIQLALLIDSFSGGSTHTRVVDWMNGANLPALVHAVWIFFIIFNGISIFLIGQLVFFHIKLQRANLTTYGYIVQESARRRQLRKQQADIQELRLTKIAKATAEGRTGEAQKLQWGGHCRSMGCTVCDPLEIPPELLATGTQQQSQSSGTYVSPQAVVVNGGTPTDTSKPFGVGFAGETIPLSADDDDDQQQQQRESTDENDQDLIETAPAYSSSGGDSQPETNGVTFIKVHDDGNKKKDEATNGTNPQESVSSEEAMTTISTTPPEPQKEKPSREAPPKELSETPSEAETPEKGSEVPSKTDVPLDE